MNAALNIKNWSAGGNSYVLKGNPKNQWCGFQVSVIEELKSRFGNQFNIVIWIDKNIENDYYCIPFLTIEHLFTEERKTTGKFSNRWTAIIKDGYFLMHSNQKYSTKIAQFYAINLTPATSIDLEDDFFIENAKAEINVRIGQSKFRKSVLKNFENKCAVTDISEKTLLRASHIIPWSHRKECRGDISNGICLYTEIDSLFDKGYISISDDLEIILSSKFKKSCPELIKRIEYLRGRKLRAPKRNLNIEYLKYHRENILL